MKGRIIIKYILSMVCLVNAKAFSQYKSLTESPMFKKDKVNLFQDSLGKKVYTLAHLDSLYQAGQAKFQIYNFHTNEDTIFWHLRFITELPAIRPEWINKAFPRVRFKDINNVEAGNDAFRGKLLIVNCWSVTCGPCVAEIPYLNKLVDSLVEKGVVFLALTYDEPGEIKKFLGSEKLKKF